MKRVIVLTSSAFGTASLCLPTLASSDLFVVAAVVLVEQTKPASSRKRKLKKALRIGLLGALNGIRIRPWFTSQTTEHLATICDRLRIPLQSTNAIDSQHTANLFAAADADLGVSLGNSYIPRRIFTIPRLGMVNLHGERLPEYQNAQSVIWPIYNMEMTTGLSIHGIDDKIDTGPILYKEEYPIVFRPSLKDTVIASTRVTARKAPAAVRYVCENYESLVEIATPQNIGKKYTTPSLGAFLRMVRNNRRLRRLTIEARE